MSDWELTPLPEDSSTEPAGKYYAATCTATMRPTAVVFTLFVAGIITAMLWAHYGWTSAVIVLVLVTFAAIMGREWSSGKV